MPHFEPAQDLCRRFYRDVLSPAIAVPHSAGLLGPGSDVLGYDTERSTDHDWGPRATVLVAPEHVAETAARIAAALPDSYDGWPVRMGRDGMPTKPHVEVATLSAWMRSQFGFDPIAEPMTSVDWLLLPQQRLLGVTAGAMFADDTGALARARATLDRYPDDVWWWMIACQWRRLDQEEPFVARAAEVGDDLGSSVIASRQVRDCLRLALLLDRRYAPYSKWLGTAFSRLDDPDGLGAHLRGALAARGSASCELALGEAYRVLAGRFNARNDGPPVDTTLRPFFDRPARTLGAERFAQAALRNVDHESLRGMPLVGSIDQFVDSTDLLSSPGRSVVFRAFYDGLPAG